VGTALDKVLRLSGEATEVLELTWSKEAREASALARSKTRKTKLPGHEGSYQIHATPAAGGPEKPIGHVLKAPGKTPLHEKYTAHVAEPGGGSRHIGAFSSVSQAHDAIHAHHDGVKTEAQKQHERLGIKPGDLADRAAAMYGAGSKEHHSAINRHGAGKIVPHSAPAPGAATPHDVPKTPRTTAQILDGDHAKRLRNNMDAIAAKSKGNASPEYTAAKQLLNDHITSEKAKDAGPAPVQHTPPVAKAAKPDSPFMADHKKFMAGIKKVGDDAENFRHANPHLFTPELKTTTAPATSAATKIDYNRKKPKTTAQRQAVLVGKKGRTHLSHVLDAARILNG
jgi:hypothetical protein